MIDFVVTFENIGKQIEYLKSEKQRLESKIDQIYDILSSGNYENRLEKIEELHKNILK